MNIGNKFVGIAYWTVTTSVADWLAKALDVLTPLETAGLAVLAFDCLPAGNQMTVQFGEERHQMLVTSGSGSGVVRPAVSAPAFVLCLVAIRKALGDITLVTESQETVPTRPRQQHPLFADCWLRVLPVAQELGLVADAQFTVRNAAIFNNMF